MLEGPAVSRKNMKIAWTVNFRQYPENLKQGQYLFYMADIIYKNGKPILSDKKIILDNLKISGKDGGIETQNFVPPDENMLTFTGYGAVMLLNIVTGEIANISNAGEYDDEPEGIFPDGKYNLY